MKSKIIRYFTILFLLDFFGFQYNGYSQACCSGGVPFSNNLGIRPIDNKNLQLRLVYDYNSLQSLYNGTTKLNDRTTKRATQTFMFHSIYGLTDKLSMSGLFSFIVQERVITSPDGSKNFVNAKGIGDAVLLIQYKLFSDFSNSLFLSSGAKFPLGKTEITNPDEGFLLPADLQPGTGSWDVIFGVAYIKNGLLRPSMSLIINTFYRYNNKAERYNGQQVYKFGNELQITIGISDQILINKFLINPSFLIRYRQTVADEVDGNIFPGTGGRWLYFGPEMNFNITQNLAVNFSGEFPFYRNLTGTQLTTDYRFVFGLNYIFVKNEKTINLNI